MRRAARALLLLLAPSLAAAAQETSTAVVQMADGSSFPLRGWSLSYDFMAWKSGTPQHQAAPQQRQATELWLGKLAYPLKGALLEIEYETASRERVVDGAPRLVAVRVARAVAVTAAGRKRQLIKLEGPRREFLIPGADKNLLLVVRSLDLRGETLTGTKRSLCLLSFSSLVECPDEASQQVAKVEFQP